MKIVEAHKELLSVNSYYEKSRDTFIFEFPDGTEEYASEIIDERKLYPVGNSVWIWEEI